MVSDRLALLRRRNAVAWAIVVAVIVVIVAFNSSYDVEAGLGTLALISTWLLITAWVWLDSAYRGKESLLLVILTLLAGPVTLFFYLVIRPSVPDICAKCGSQLDPRRDTCPCCGNGSLLRSVVGKLQWVSQELMKSIAGGPVDKSRETVKYLAIGAAVAAAFFWFGAFASGGRVILFPIMLLLSMASYWVLVAWWVYLDATWRRMEAVPWGLLALVTNIFGLVTYLVIRYPEPRVCPQCSASLPTDLKRCPYCGSEVEPTCSRCQSAVQPDWLYCPACAAQITRPQQTPPAVAMEDERDSPVQPTVCIRGTVVDAATGAPVSDALVKIDSRSGACSTTTDGQGRYELPDVPLRPYVLLASAEGYAVDAQPFEPGVGALPQVHFSLQPLAVESSGVSS